MRIGNGMRGATGVAATSNSSARAKARAHRDVASHEITQTKKPGIAKQWLASIMACALALTMMPSAGVAFAAEVSSGGGSALDKDLAATLAETSAGESQDVITTEVGEVTLPVDGADEDPVVDIDANAAGPETPDIISNEVALDASADAATGEDISIPAAMERINEDVALTQPVAQQESTRSYFLAQTLENTKTVPIVSANLPLDTGMASAEVVEPVEGEGDDQSGEEGGEDSDESDLPASNIIAADSTVVGSFTYRGITYAVEPGGESVAAVASDYAKLPEAFIEAQTIVLPSAVTADGIDYYSVTRIADNAFASLTSEAASQYVASIEASASDEAENADNESADSTDGAAADITVLGIPSSITSIDDDAFAGFDTLQYIVVEDGNPNYATYDGVLYNADQTCLLLVPEGRLGAVRVAPSVAEVKAEAFSHCSSVEAVVADPESAAIQLLEGNDSLADSDIAIKTTDEIEGALYAASFTDLAAIEAMIPIEWTHATEASSVGVSTLESASRYNALGTKTITARAGGSIQKYYYWNYTMSDYDYTYEAPRDSVSFITGMHDVYAYASFFNNEQHLTLFIYSGTTDCYTICYKAVSNPHFYFCGWSVDNGTGRVWPNATDNAKDVIAFGTVKPDFTIYANFVASPDYMVEALDGGQIQTTSAHANNYLGTGKTGGIPNTAMSVWDMTLTGAGGFTINIWTDATKTKKMYYTVGSVLPDTGYEFAGWSASSNGSGASKTNVSLSGTNGGGKLYYAVFKAKSVAITWNPNGGNWSNSTANKSSNQTYGNALTLWGTNPTRDGYRFDGWYTAASGGSQVTAANTTVPASATTYWAHWTKNSVYTITLNSQLWSSSSSTVATSSATTAGTTAIYYWVGKGWFNTSDPSDSATGATTSTALITAPTLNGYTYGGYWTAKTGITTQKIDGTKLKSTDAVTGDATWWAKWTKNDVYTITLNSQLWQYSYSSTAVCNATSAGTSTIYYWVGKGWFTSSSPSASTLPATTTTSLITTPTLNGYKFEGYWNTKTGTGTQMTDGQKLKSVDAPTVTNKAATWYAKWTIDTVYTVTLDSQLWPSSSASSATCSATTAGTTKIYYWKGVGWYSSTKSYGANPTGAATTATALITAPTLNGYAFGGYWTGKTGTTTQKIDGTNLKSTDAPTVNSSNEATWYAKWTKNSIYTITLNSQLWASSSANSAASNATTTGTTAIYYWVGKGWYNTSNPSATATAATEATALITTPTLSGYTFKGYTTGKAGSGTPTMSEGGKLSSTNAPTVDSANKATWYAKWEIKSVYTVTLNSQLWATSNATNAVCNATNAGTTALYYWDGVGWFKTTKSQGDAPTGAASTSTSLVTPPTLNGYGFSCYRTEKAGNGDRKTSTAYLTSIDAISGNTTWYAEWSINPVYTVTLNSQLWASSSAGSSVCNATSAGTTALYYWKGVGWFNASKAYGANPTGGATNSTDLITTPSLNGYDFGGYWTGKTGTTAQKTDGKRLNSTDAIDAGTTWYAKWTIRPVHTVTLNSQLWDSASATTAKGDATVPGTAALYYWDGVGWFNTAKSQGANPTGAATTSSALVTTPTLVGYTFGGYYSGKAATGSQMTEGALLKSTDPIASGTTWYAKWTINKHTVSWRYNGAKDKSDFEQKNISYDSGFTLIEPGSKPGYKFTGWQASGADEASYPEGFSYRMPDGDVIFTATWSAHPYTKVVLSDPYLTEPAAQGAVWYWPERGYVQSPDSKDVKEKGVHIKDIPNLKALGYEFLGWFDDVNENQNAAKMIDENGDVCTDNGPGTPAEGEAIVWYAHWNRVSCPVDLVASYEPATGEEAFAIENAGDYLAKIQYAYFGKGFNESSVENGKIAEDLLPKRVGYTFMGYYTQKNPELSVADSKDQASYAGVQWIDEKGNLSDEKWRETPAKRGSIALYAAWRLDECEVTFDVRGNVKANTEAVTVIDESSLDGTVWCYGKPKRDIPAPGNASFDRTGYEFGGWYYLKDANGQDVESNRQFVSDSKGKPTPANWDVVKTSVTLYPAWTPKTYMVELQYNYPAVAGAPAEEVTSCEIGPITYDTTLDLSEYEPSYLFYTFENWYAKATDQLFEGAHMTANADGTKRFTPRGMVAQTNPIEVYARWMDPGKSSYTLYVGEPGGTELVSETQHEYKWTETIVFNGTEAPALVENYRFVGWVWVESDDAARKMIAAGGPEDTDETWSGFGPLSTKNLYFVAKWAPVKLSLTLQSTQPDDESAWLVSTDILENYGGQTPEGVKSWEETCESLNEERFDLARFLHYDTTQDAFVLPDVVRKGQTFLGWKLKGSPEPARRGVVVRPDTQDNAEMRDLVYIPVFKDAIYKIVLDGQGIGETKEYPNIAYSESFTFPYPATLNTGSVFACWSSKPDTNSDAAEVFFPLGEPTPLAPIYDETGNVKEDGFGLAQIAEVDEDGNNVIRVYAVWNSDYHVDVPLFANLAIDTERGDVIAGVNTISPDDRNKDADATYRIESIRYEPLKNKEGEDGKYAFEGAEDKVYLSVYAGLNTGEATDLEHLLYAENIDKDGGADGEVTYTDADGDTAKAKPLLIELGGESTVLYGRTAPTGQASLESVTDEDAPYGFVTFSASNPLTIRYGLYFEDDQTRKDFAFGSTKYAWLLPENDATNKAESIDPGDANFGRRNAWSGNTVDIAKLHYTVSIVSATK